MLHVPKNVRDIAMPRASKFSYHINSYNLIVYEKWLGEGQQARTGGHAAITTEHAHVLFSTAFSRALPLERRGNT